MAAAVSARVAAVERDTSVTAVLVGVARIARGPDPRPLRHL